MKLFQHLQPTECDLCGSQDFTYVYEPIGSRRGAVVCVCNNCGLMFSQSMDVQREYHAEPSGDANWGGVRFCKSQRLDDLKGQIPTNFDKILDIGSSRGDFLHWYQSKNPNAELWGVEPDPRFFQDYPSPMRGINAKLEKCVNELPKNYFDFIYCVQTLEHTDSPKQILEIAWELLKPNGMMLLEVPSTLDVISYPLNVEEYFIDKHTHHFSFIILCEYLKTVGLKVHDCIDDNLNLSMFITKGQKPEKPIDSLYYYAGDIVDDHIDAINEYADTIYSNRRKLPGVVSKLNRVLNTNMKIAWWGANTLIDLLVKYGGLDPSRVGFLVDTYMAGKQPDIQGIPIHYPDELRKYQPEVCIIMARFSTPEIEKQARAFGIPKIITFESLIR